MHSPDPAALINVLAADLVDAEQRAADEQLAADAERLVELLRGPWYPIDRLFEIATLAKRVFGVDGT